MICSPNAFLPVAVAMLAVAMQSAPPADKPAPSAPETPAAPAAPATPEAPATPAKPADPPATPKAADPVGRVALPTKDDLTMRPGSLVLITDKQSGQPYWVFSFTIVNTTGKAQRFTPRFELVTGEGIILSAGSDVPPEAERRIQRAMGKLEAADQFQIMGEVLEGEANAREGFAIWPAAIGDAKELTLFVTGLSRAIDTKTDPATGKATKLKRTHQRKYSVPGNPDPRIVNEAGLVSETWIMR